MSVWGDVKALYGEGGLEIVTAVGNLSIRTIIQPDADMVIWLPDFTKPEIDADQFRVVWLQHQQAVTRRLAWLNRLSWLIQRGGMLLVPFPLLMSVIINISRDTVDQIITYVIGLAASTIFYFLRRQLAQLVAQMGGRILRSRLQKYMQNFLAGKMTPPQYGLET